MKSHVKILLAFVLNLAFAIFELIGGIFSGSIAILSDSAHDFADALSIGFSFLLERKSIKKANKTYTYGYGGFSLLGGFFTTLMLIIGSILMIYLSIEKIVNPTPVNFDLMIIFGVVGVVINFLATIFTKHGHSLNQRAVNLHMLEDVFGWLVVLIGAIVMRFTGFTLLDPILYIVVALFILYKAIVNIIPICHIFTYKTPKNICPDNVKSTLENIDGITDVHHIHIWNISENVTCATMHVVSNFQSNELKHEIKHTLHHLGISHATIEFENENELCLDQACQLSTEINQTHCHHHH